jgi:hypothetical protein
MKLRDFVKKLDGSHFECVRNKDFLWASIPEKGVVVIE